MHREFQTCVNLPSCVARAVLPWFVATLLLVNGCVFVGPASISGGRMAYNEVINYTEDQQLLSAVVRERYGQTFGLVSVSSVAANVKFRGNMNAEFPAWGSDAFTDQLVPLSLGTAYEENPTISYVPLQGEDVLRSFVTPLTIEEGFLVQSAATERHIVDRFIFRHLGVLKVPIDRPMPPDTQRGFLLWAKLREAGVLRFGRAPAATSEQPKYAAIFIGYSEEHIEAISEFLGLLGIDGQTVDGRKIVLPFVMSAAGETKDTIYVESRSVLEWLRLAAIMVEVPASHLKAGIVEPTTWAGEPEYRFITVRSSRIPPSNAVVSVPFRGWWFYIDATDSRSKNSWRLIRFVVRLRLSPRGAQQQVPVLTVPVG